MVSLSRTPYLYPLQDQREDGELLVGNMRGNTACFSAVSHFETELALGWAGTREPVDSQGCA